MVAISVIIPNYNNAKFIKKTIESVYNQTLNEIEVICVDDGSTDNSIKVLNKLQNKYSSLKVFSQENQGPGIARNNALKECCGEYVVFLDSDDVILDKNSLKDMYNFAKKEKLNMVSANLVFLDKKYNVKEFNHHYETGDYCYFDKYCIIHPIDYGIPYGFTKAIFNLDFLKSHNIIFPDVLAGEDPIFLAKVFANLSKIGGVPLNMYGYNHTVGGGVNKKINSYEKKRHYVTHFKTVCDILDSANLLKISNDYKNHLFRYLTWSNNDSDYELMRIFNLIFANVSEDYFDKNDEMYIKFIISYKYHLLLQSNSNELFNHIKEEFLSINLEMIEEVKTNTLRRYLLVINSESLDNFKSKVKDMRLYKANKESKKLKMDNFKYIKQNENLNEQLSEVDKFNESLLNSSSWKLTKPLRLLTRLFK